MIYEPRSEAVEGGGGRKLINGYRHKFSPSTNVIGLRNNEDQLSRIFKTYGGDYKCIQNFS